MSETNNQYTPELGALRCTQFKGVVDGLLAIYRIKNRNYNDSFAKQFKNNGMHMVAMRLNDKCSRIEALVNNPDTDLQGESITDTLADLANYSIMALMALTNGGN